MLDLPVTIISSDEFVIGQLKSLEMWETFQRQVDRVKHLQKQCVVFLDRCQAQADYYVYFFGFDNPADNGYMLYRIPEPGKNPEVVKVIEGILKGIYNGSRASVLWVDDPGMRN